MDYKPLPIGIDNFETLMTEGYYFCGSEAICLGHYSKDGRNGGWQREKIVE